MADPIRNILSFDIGIVDIMRENPMERAQMPDSSALLPSDDTVNLQLDRVNFLQSIGESLRRTLRPSVTDKSVLGRARFGAMLDEVQSVTDSIKQEGSPPSAAVEQLSRIIAEEQDMHVQLETHRMALYQG